MRVKVYDSAKLDFKEIRAVLNNYGIVPTNKFRNAYKNFLIHVKRMPKMYPIYEFNSEFRAAVLIYDYIVFYDIDEAANLVNVYHILHSRQNTVAILKNT